jgi:hypothetical protein
VGSDRVRLPPAPVHGLDRRRFRLIRAELRQRLRNHCGPVNANVIAKQSKLRVSGAIKPYLNAVAASGFLALAVGALARCAAHFRYCRRFASAFCRPASVRGPVLRPPCHLQRFRPGILIVWQGVPRCVRARHLLRSDL